MYIATYSNIEVYECSVNEMPIMRRCKDNWVNATQILKLCNFPKAKRTKILEKGVQQGQHEKVQGGYGRFQGTWIPLPEARNLANEYGITSDMVPVLYIDPSDTSVIIPKKKPPVSSSSSAVNKDGTPVKRKYVKKNKKNDTPKKLRLSNSNLPPQAVFTQDGYSHSLPRDGNAHMNQSPIGSQHGFNNQAQMPMQGMPPTFQSQEFVGNGNFSNSQRVNMNGFNGQQSNFGAFPNQMQGYNQYSARQMGSLQDDGLLQQQQQQQLLYQQHQKGTLSQSTNDANWSQEEHQRDSDTSISSVDGHHHQKINEDDTFAAQLLRFFSEDNTPIPTFLYNPPPEFNINEAIDDEGHTALHWAASIGNCNLVQLLLSKGANALVVNNHGLNPLSKCISFNNCHELRNFPQMLDALEVCLIHTDINGRTPLHYLCQFSRVTSKVPSLIHYLEQIFNKLTIMTTKNGGSGVNLLRNVIDHQDVNGDTCLHLAAWAGCTHFVKFLLSNGARDDLVNVNNEASKSIIMQQGLVIYNVGILQDQSGMQQFYPSSGLEVADKRVNQQAGLGTPIQPFNNRRLETPDTQRTTIQDDEEEELNDRVSKEHLRMLMEGQAGTVEENKENVFIDDASKVAYEAMSTPKQNGPSPHSANKQGVLGVISEATVENSPLPKASPGKAVIRTSALEVKLDKSGNDDPDVKPPINDTSKMMLGMVTLLTDSYHEEISGLNKDKKKLVNQIQSKNEADQAGLTKIKSFMSKNGFENVNSYDDAYQLVVNELDCHKQDIKTKEQQLLCLIEKVQAFELANTVHEKEKEIRSPTSDTEDSSDCWQLAMELSHEQLRRNNLVNQVAQGVKQWAINPKMNKYRKLISLSCGLRVEDIDGLIDGIEKSLMEGTM